MTPRRLLAVALAGAVLRELLPHLRRLADWADPCGSAPGWTALEPVVREVAVAPDYIPDALLVRW